ncbi:hypothetical protein PENTCL1PPCAC_30593, partial [Pristionchus entomophagus]
TMAAPGRVLEGLPSNDEVAAERLTHVPLAFCHYDTNELFRFVLKQMAVRYANNDSKMNVINYLLTLFRSVEGNSRLRGIISTMNFALGGIRCYG